MFFGSLRGLAWTCAGRTGWVLTGGCAGAGCAAAGVRSSTPALPSSLDGWLPQPYSTANPTAANHIFLLPFSFFAATTPGDLFTPPHPGGPSPPPVPEVTRRHATATLANSGHSPSIYKKRAPRRLAHIRRLDRQALLHASV